MKTILYMAISLNGKITGKDDDTSWVTPEDVERMDTLMTECGVMLMGSKTYQSFGDDLPNDKAYQIVVTNNQELLSKQQDNVTFTNKPLKEILNDIEAKGYKSVLIAGGSELNTSLIQEDLIDEIRLIVKPMILGSGKALFNDFEKYKNFKVVSTEQLPNGSVELTVSK